MYLLAKKNCIIFERALSAYLLANKIISIIFERALSAYLPAKKMI